MEGGGQMNESRGSNGGEGQNIAQELFGRRDESVNPDPTSFTEVFPPAATVVERNRAAQRPDNPPYIPNEAMPDESSIQQSTNREEEEGSKIFSDEKIIEPTLFTSSIHYGGRPYYASPDPKPHEKDATDTFLGDGLIDPDVADRGDWWRGSLYY